MKRIFRNTWMKLIGVILLCVCMYGILYGTYMSYEYSYFNIGNVTSFSQTQDAQDIMQNEAVIAASCSTNGSPYVSQPATQKLYSIFSKENSNSRFSLAKYMPHSGKYEFIAGNIVDTDSYGTQQTWLVACDEDGCYITDGIPDTETEAVFFQSTIALSDPITVHDRYYDSYQKYLIAKQDGKSGIVVLIVSLALFVFTLVNELKACGHNSKDEEIHLLKIDSFPWDILAAITAFVCPVILKAGSWLTSDTRKYQEMNTLAVSFILACAIFYLWLTSMVRRGKAHTLGNSFLIGKVFTILPAAWRILLPACILWFLQLTLDSRLVIILNTIALLAVIWLCMEWNVIFRAGIQLQNGNISCQIPDKDLKHMAGSMKKHAQNLNSISGSLNIALNEQVKSERLKAELITNVSHDIKTPLTSIINYVDLLQKPHTEEEEKQYLEVLTRQSARLKKLTEDVVEASKASTGNISVNMTDTNVKEIMEQAYAEYEDRFRKADLECIMHCEDDLAAYADGRLLWRVLRNLLSNAGKYSAEHSRVYFDAFSRDGNIVISLKNTSREPLNITSEELMERFVRGDSSRHTEGSGLGLSIAQSLMELMQGKLQLIIDGDLFKAECILLPGKGTEPDTQPDRTPAEEIQK